IGSGGLADDAADCPRRDGTTVPAQWLRIAYHDASTHDIEGGTGGLDASIQYELDRPENIGVGMAASLLDFNIGDVIAPFFGMADAIALGAVFAVVGCGGPLIPFSAGRVDATAAGPSTVPQPQQPLASHIESFRLQGFNQTEMISLVACGHTLGGVRQADFPLIVPDSSIDVDTFDTTPAFDTTIVSQYLQNTTEDVLVVGPNVTTRSDFRIFSSDGNATMQSLLSPDTFSATCRDLIQRLINNVPNGVNLTEPMNEPPSANPTLTMLWADRQGDPSFCPSTGCSIQSSGTEQAFFNIIGKAQGLTAERYSFNATINATSSISHFWFEIDNNDGSDPIIVDNGGSGFVIAQDSMFVDIGRTKIIITANSIYYKLIVAVRGDGASTSISLTAFDPLSISSAPPFLPTITSYNLHLDESNPPEGGFAFFTTNITSITTSFLDISSIVDRAAFTQQNFDLTNAANFLEVLE
ncbi:heme peroxidase, partial [Gymnopus androsaceus JB14]